VPVSRFAFQVLSAGRCQFVELRPAFGIGDAPFRTNGPILFQLQQRRIERPVIDTQSIAADLLDPLGEPIPMLRPHGSQRAKHHKRQRAQPDFILVPHHSTPWIPIYTKWSYWSAIGVSSPWANRATGVLPSQSLCDLFFGARFPGLRNCQADGSLAAGTRWLYARDEDPGLQRDLVGDCVQQAPLVQRIAKGNTARINLHFVGRRMNGDLIEELQVGSIFSLRCSRIDPASSTLRRRREHFGLRIHIIPAIKAL